MKQIPLTLGKKAIVSDCDYGYLRQWKWYFFKSGRGGYAKRTTKVPRQCVLMHKVIAERKGIQGEVDHRNRNKLDNQRRNLRPATRGQNVTNSDLRSDNSTGYRRVYWAEWAGKYRAYITHRGKRIYLGYFQFKKDAARAYNKAALTYYGPFAYQNRV
jgi:hypothetical protein